MFEVDDFYQCMVISNLEIRTLSRHVLRMPFGCIVGRVGLKLSLITESELVTVPLLISREMVPENDESPLYLTQGNSPFIPSLDDLAVLVGEVPE